VCYRPFVAYYPAMPTPLKTEEGKEPTPEEKARFSEEVKRCKAENDAINEEMKKMGYVVPKVLNCNHAICEECAVKCYEKRVQYVGHGVRCPFHKRDQLGNPPFVCGFVTPKSATTLEEVQKNFDDAIENIIIAKVLRDTNVLLGTSNPRNPQGKLAGKEAEFFYWYKFCRGCQKASTCVCKNCRLAFCDDCWTEHVKGNAGHEKKSRDDYEKEEIRCHECDECKKQGKKNSHAYKFCGICKKWLCRNRKTCFDPCMDPDHLLIEFDPSLAEMKRFEAKAQDDSKKMFIHDNHDYLETNPFLWQGADMESLCRTVWHQAHEEWKEREQEKLDKIRARKEGGSKPGEQPGEPAAAAAAAAPAAGAADADFDPTEGLRTI